ncbi:hypothetical protein [Desulfosarcina ovata]|uniref:Uncharacterized protein n=1 Tax=Desulfosarcina ovata subsp. ovata TaxID=2752305 RepID=A0A5K8ADJ5_9BACT|nr:hypothetical protein [Desulfosarcina ovata]BBO90641.1 hypothetical protein DSCOOX_38210 [Desulfosarcina ovata subsp. ovata]
MKPKRHTIADRRGLTRRQLLAVGTLNLLGWAAFPMRTVAAPFENDLKLVAHIPEMVEREGPLRVFRDYAADPDNEIEQHLRRELVQRSELLSKIKARIGFERKVRFSVEDLEVRLMFVPQSDKRHAAAYQRYCQDITDYLFEINRAENFYSSITSPHEDHPVISETGVSAFIVHRLAKAYRAVCRFTAESGKSVKYAASGAIFSNHLGAVDLEIERLAPGRFGLRRPPFTIWQNSGAEFFSLMAIPVEETLHYYLGRATDRLLDASLRQDPSKSLAAARQMADEWMAVEESVVGGLVDRVLARYCDRYPGGLPDNLNFERWAGNVPDLSQYRYRRQGIQLVRTLGIHRSIGLYMEDPGRFREQLKLT